MTTEYIEIVPSDECVVPETMEYIAVLQGSNPSGVQFSIQFMDAERQVISSVKLGFNVHNKEMPNESVYINGLLRHLKGFDVVEEISTNRESVYRLYQRSH